MCSNIFGNKVYTLLARIRLLSRFTTCLAQTATASRLLFAIGWHFMHRECELFLKKFVKFVPLSEHI